MPYIAHPAPTLMNANENGVAQGVLGESQARTGNYRGVIESLTVALQTLPQEEVLLKARAYALLADALDRLGQAEAARAHYVSAFDLDPRVFRALGLAIPVRVHSDNDAWSRAAASWLKRSPRFRSGNTFVVVVSRSGDGLDATLEDPSGRFWAARACRGRRKAARNRRGACTRRRNRNSSSR